MEWVEEMKTAMKMMKNACRKNELWYKCEDCPFDEYCDLFVDSGSYIPQLWEIE